MSELQEVDIEKELAKSDNEDVPEITIQTEPLADSDSKNLTQKELLASLIEGSPDNVDEQLSKSPLEGEVDEQLSKSPLEGEVDEQLSKSPLEGEVDETVLSKSPLEGEVDETVLSKSPLEGEVDETVLSKSPLEGEVDETVLSKSPLEEGEVDETLLNINPLESKVDDDDEDTSDEDEETVYKNLEEDIDKNILKFYHPETQNINYKELLTLSKITKNKKGEIIDKFHKTIPFLTQYEKAKILGQRAKQINHGSTPFIDVPSNIIDGHTIALMELNQKKIPFIIRRPLPSGHSEYWKVKDLKIL